MCEWFLDFHHSGHGEDLGERGWPRRGAPGVETRRLYVRNPPSWVWGECQMPDEGKKYSVDDLFVLSWPDAIRDRPELYLGKKSQLSLAQALSTDILIA